jgi:hypothetical protein
MKTVVNSQTGILEAFLPGTILSINDSDVKTNEKGTKYKKCMVLMEYPDGSTEETQSIFYVNAQVALPEVYAVGAKIELAIQIEGEYAGNSSVQAPPIKRVDVAKVISFLDKFKTATTNVDGIAVEA